jgi:ABC-2 type transport system ATP-binding protein
VLALRINELVKRYGSFTAVDGISFDVPEGEFFGLLGPNGAGKTTTINSIVGLSRITAGSIQLFGLDVEKDWRATRRLVGLAPQEYNFDRYLNIRDILIYQAGYYGLHGKAIEERADELLERFGLSSKAKQIYTRLSGGMKRRLTIARALMFEPRLLILDEPTAGVDVELRMDLWRYLQELNRDGTTILLTSHYLEEIERLCRTIAIVAGGRIVRYGPKEEFFTEPGGLERAYLAATGKAAEHTAVAAR